MEIRDLMESDINKVMEIENLCFVAPWKKEDILRELKDNKFATLLVATVNEEVVGYVDFWVTFDSATICQIAVHPNYQRQHIGSLLLEEVLKECYAKKVLTITLEVRESNSIGINFYTKHGFNQFLVKPNYYSNGENAIYMMKGVE
jgi:ribosomal-protein-alanine N-acetyltransferase